MRLDDLAPKPEWHPVIETIFIAASSELQVSIQYIGVESRNRHKFGVGHRRRKGSVHDVRMYSMLVRVPTADL